MRTIKSFKESSSCGLLQVKNLYMCTGQEIQKAGTF
jgi:hypothetical protein